MVYLRNIVTRALEIGATGAVLQREATQTRVRYTAEGKELEVVDYPHLRADEFVGVVERCIAACHPWTESTDGTARKYTSGQVGGTGRRSRLLCAPVIGQRWIADIVRKGDRGFALENICASRIPPAYDWLSLSEHDRTALRAVGESQKGLILCNFGTTQLGSATTSPTSENSIDGVSVSEALFPASPVILKPTVDELKKAIQDAQSGLVVIALSTPNPVERIFQVLGQLEGMPEAQREFIDSLLLSFSYCGMRRVCQACGRATRVDPRTVEKLPKVLAPELGRTYPFGRGCNECGLTAYRGTAGIGSFALLSEGTRTALHQRATERDVTRMFYESGTRALLEDGLDKIFQGVTSFEDVLGVTGSVLPELFAEVIIESKKKTEPQVTSGEPLLSSARPSMLIAEDDADQRNVLQMIFASAGYDVTTVEDGAQALQALQGQRFDILVCDLMMPGISGQEVLQRVREHPNWQRLPILMLTAASTPENEFSLLDLGADDFCPKTVRRKILLKRVERLLQRKGQNPVGHLLVD